MVCKKVEYFIPVALAGLSRPPGGRENAHFRTLLDDRTGDDRSIVSRAAILHGLFVGVPCAFLQRPPEPRVLHVVLANSLGGEDRVAVAYLEVPDPAEQAMQCVQDPLVAGDTKKCAVAVTAKAAAGPVGHVHSCP